MEDKTTGENQNKTFVWLLFNKSASTYKHMPTGLKWSIQLMEKVLYFFSSFFKSMDLLRVLSLAFSG